MASYTRSTWRCIFKWNGYISRG